MFFGGAVFTEDDMDYSGSKGVRMPNGQKSIEGSQVLD